MTKNEIDSDIMKKNKNKITDTIKVIIEKYHDKKSFKINLKNDFDIISFGHSKSYHFWGCSLTIGKSFVILFILFQVSILIIFCHGSNGILFKYNIRALILNIFL